MKAVSGLVSERDGDDGRGLQTTSNFNLSKSLEVQTARVGDGMGRAGVQFIAQGVLIKC